SETLSLLGPFTLQATIRLDGRGIAQSIIEKYDEPGINGYFLRMNQSGKLEAAVCDSTAYRMVIAVGASFVTPGEWHRVAAVFDGTSNNVYLDGLLGGAC